MKIRTLSVALAIVILSACARTTDTDGPLFAETLTPIIDRTAMTVEVENDVQAAIDLDMTFRPAFPGLLIPTGGQVRSGLDGRARLDLLPEGTILRLGPETRFTLSILGEDPNDPFASLLLEAGRLWVILTGGSLNVETGLGIASVRGSFLGVSFDPGMQQMVATCLEGICSLWNEAGTVNLRTGQAAEITGTGQPPSPVRPFTDDEVTEWRENNPEAVDIELPVYPSPTPSPLGWTITNNCEESYQFVFTGVETLELIVEAGQTITGELPRGKYLLTHTPVDDGYASESEIKEEVNDFSITICSSE